MKVAHVVFPPVKPSTACSSWAPLCTAAPLAVASITVGFFSSVRVAVTRMTMVADKMQHFIEHSLHNQRHEPSLLSNIL